MEPNLSIENRRRIEKMTVDEIREAKMRLEDRIGEAIEREIEEFSKVYDWGHIDVSVDTDIEYCYMEGQKKDKRMPMISCIKRNVRVKSDLLEDL